MQDALKGLRKTLIYKVVNLLNGKLYIGVTVKGISRRRTDHWSEAKKAKKPVYFHKALLKYGIENFRFTMLKECPSYDEALREEVRLIALWKPDYNTSAGGEGTLGVKKSPEAIAKIRAANIGRIGYWKGKKRPPNIGEAVRIRNLQPDKKAKWIERQKLAWIARRKSVVCLNDKRQFESANAAAAFYGIHATILGKSCLTKTRRAGNRYFRYLDDKNGLKDSVAALEAKRIAEARYRACFIRMKKDELRRTSA